MARTNSHSKPQPEEKKPDEQPDPATPEQLAPPEISPDAPLETFDEDDDEEELTTTDVVNGLTPAKIPRGRQGDQTRPTCPQCSTADKPVLLTASSTRSLFTWYSCECGHRVKIPRPNINQIMGRRRNQDEDFSAR